MHFAIDAIECQLLTALFTKNALWIDRIYYRATACARRNVVLPFLSVGRSVRLSLCLITNTGIFQVLFIVSLFCVWNITTVEINSGFYLLKS